MPDGVNTRARALDDQISSHSDQISSHSDQLQELRSLILESTQNINTLQKTVANLAARGPPPDKPPRILTFQQSLDALHMLYQATTVAEYQLGYEDLMKEITGVSEMMLISFFITNLRPDIHRELLRRGLPSTLKETFALAQACEAHIEKEKARLWRWCVSPYSIAPNPTPLGSTMAAPPSASSSPLAALDPDTHQVISDPHLDDPMDKLDEDPPPAPDPGKHQAIYATSHLHPPNMKEASQARSICKFQDSESEALAMGKTRSLARPHAQREFLCVIAAFSYQSLSSEDPTHDLLESLAKSLTLYPTCRASEKVARLPSDVTHHLSKGGTKVSPDYYGFNLFSDLQSSHNYEPTAFGLSEITTTFSNHALFGGVEDDTVELDIKATLMLYLKIPENVYSLMFTVSRGSAFKLFASCYPFHTHKKLLIMFDHENQSVHWMASHAKEKVFDERKAQGGGGRLAAGIWDHVKRVFDQMPQRDLVSRKARGGGYAWSGFCLGILKAIVGPLVSALYSLILIVIRNRGLFAFSLWEHLVWSSGPMLHRFGYHQGCQKNITHCFFNTAPVVDHCEGTLHNSNTEGQLYSLHIRQQHFLCIHDFSLVDKFLTVKPENNGCLFVTFPRKPLLMAFEVLTGHVLWQCTLGPLSIEDTLTIVDSNGWVSISSIYGYLYSFSPNGDLEKFYQKKSTNSVAQVSPLLDGSGFAVYVSQTIMAVNLSHNFGYCQAVFEAFPAMLVGDWMLSTSTWKSPSRWKLNVLFLIFFYSIASGVYVGINIGADMSNWPSPSDAVSFLQSYQIKQGWLFAADHQMSNAQMLQIRESKTEATYWVRKKNIAAFVVTTNITYIVVWALVLTTLQNAVLVLIPASTCNFGHTITITQADPSINGVGYVLEDKDNFQGLGNVAGMEAGGVQPSSETPVRRSERINLGIKNPKKYDDYLSF